MKMQFTFYFLLMILMIAKTTIAKQNAQLTPQEMLARCKCISDFRKIIYGARFFYPVCFQFHKVLPCLNAGELEIPTFRSVEGRLINKRKVKVIKI